jgi:hypothetical protein
MENRIARIEPDPVVATATEQPLFNASNERQRAVLAKLEQGTEAILTSDGFAAYLQTLAKFHSYSFTNVILIQSQRPDATLVNAYARWKQLGRQVKKGETGIRIFFPIFRTGEDQITGEEERHLVSFGIGTVFDVAQTEGDPIADAPPITELTGTDDAATALNLKLSRFLIDEGLTLASEPMEGGKRGTWNPAKRAIAVRASATVSPFAIGPTKTLAHEAAHYLADHRGTVARDDAECVAEGAAYVTMHHFGLDTGATSFPYLAGWAKDRAVLRRNLAEIQQIGTRLITAIEDVGDPYANGYGSFAHADPWAALRDDLLAEHEAER